MIRAVLSLAAAAAHTVAVGIIMSHRKGQISSETAIMISIAQIQDGMLTAMMPVLRRGPIRARCASLMWIAGQLAAAIAAISSQQ